MMVRKEIWDEDNLILAIIRFCKSKTSDLNQLRRDLQGVGAEAGNCVMDASLFPLRTFPS
jgi:hypothetical protein